MIRLSVPSLDSDDLEAVRRVLISGQLVQGPWVAAFEGIVSTYVVLLPETVAPYRDRVISFLREKGVESTIGTYHLPLSTFYRLHYDYRPGDFPVTDQVFSRALSLPLHESLTDAEQQRVVHYLKEAVGRF